MESLPVIPASPEQRWLMFRKQGLPIIFFVLLMTCITMMWRSIVLPPALPSVAASMATTVGERRQGSPTMPVASAAAPLPAARQDVVVAPGKHPAGWH